MQGISPCLGTELPTVQAGPRQTGRLLALSSCAAQKSGNSGKDAHGRIRYACHVHMSCDRMSPAKKDSDAQNQPPPQPPFLQAMALLLNESVSTRQPCVSPTFQHRGAHPKPSNACCEEGRSTLDHRNSLFFATLLLDSSWKEDSRLPCPSQNAISTPSISEKKILASGHSPSGK